MMRHRHSRDALRMHSLPLSHDAASGEPFIRCRRSFKRSNSRCRRNFSVIYRLAPSGSVADGFDVYVDFAVRREMPATRYRISVDSATNNAEVYPAQAHAQRSLIPTRSAGIRRRTPRLR